jgi:hypothetical protein
MSGKTNHTPGPWRAKVVRVSDGNSAGWVETQISAVGRIVAVVQGYDASPDTKANAHLLASAPIGRELAEAVVVAEERFGAPPLASDWREIVEIARRLLDVADGKETKT